MDGESLFILLIIITFIARAIGEAMKGGKGKGKGQQLPPQPRPQQRVPRPQERQLPGRPGAERPAPAGETAADMIPQDLWEILTGQRREPPPPPTPEPYVDEDEELVELDRTPVVAPIPRSEDRDVEALLRRRREQLHQSRRFDHTPPKIVSLETEPASERVRHAAFHRKMVELAPPADVTRDRGAADLIDLRRPDELRRAIILQEVLGRPKGLE